MEVTLKTTYQILLRPGRSAVIISVALAALVVILTVPTAVLHSDAEKNAAIPLNVAFSLITIAVTLLPGLFLRFFSYARIADVTAAVVDRIRLKNVTMVALLIESLNIVFLLNAYLAATTGGGVGTLGVFAIAAFNIFWMIVWGVIALVLYFRRSTTIPGLKAPQTF